MTISTEKNPVDVMVEKLDSRLPGNRGYVTTTPEIIDILRNLSPRVPASVIEERRPGQTSDEVNVTITVGFMLSREELAAIAESKQA